MLNFRRLRQDLPPAVLKQGKDLFDEEAIESVRIIQLSQESMRLQCSVRGQFSNHYCCKLEIDRTDSTVVDSDCDCPYQFDCQHLAAVLLYLEENFNEVLITYSKKSSSTGSDKKEIQKEIEQATKKEEKRQRQKAELQILEEYRHASMVLSQSAFFVGHDASKRDRAELLVVLNGLPKGIPSAKGSVEVQLALRVPGRTKPLQVPEVLDFLEAVRYGEPQVLAGRRYRFDRESFGKRCRDYLRVLIDEVRVAGQSGSGRLEKMRLEALGEVVQRLDLDQVEEETGLYLDSIEHPLKISHRQAQISVDLECVKDPAVKLLLNPSLLLGDERALIEEITLVAAQRPAVIRGDVFYSFEEKVRRRHLIQLDELRAMTVPEPLFGTFAENSLPELIKSAKVSNPEVLDSVATIPQVHGPGVVCHLSYLDGELEGLVEFVYEGQTIPSAPVNISRKHFQAFVRPEGILARDLVEERRICDELFADFDHDVRKGSYSTTSYKKVVEFMTEVVPHFQERVHFHCPENLLQQFVFDNTTYKIRLQPADRVDLYEMVLEVNGPLEGMSVEQLWDCVVCRRSYVEMSLPKRKGKTRGRGRKPTLAKILVLDLKTLGRLVEVFEELGLEILSSGTTRSPIWTLANFSASTFKDLPVSFEMDPALETLREQMLGLTSMKKSAVPKNVCAKLRGYQRDGIAWLERLRTMQLAGILADDMGLGKTLQALAAIMQEKGKRKTNPSIVVCPTSLVYNWKEECLKFVPSMKVQVVDGPPNRRKELIEEAGGHDLLITSYSLLQKDIENYQDREFSYAILDEAQHIKNRTTRNAKSVKQLQARHRLILTGTPIENSLEELWSLFDFLMPGLLGTYERFNERYIRKIGLNGSEENAMQNLRQKVGPFILRRMKGEILKDLPPVSEITYHCQLGEKQRELYRSYAQSAREELSRLVEKEGFDRVQIHVLATLTRLKQICCHPALFAKDTPEEGDSAKYDMLIELIESLVSGNHKVVIFSQYTKMLGILREDLTVRNIRHCYLDGTTKDRMDVVNTFNKDPTISAFLVSLRAGGVGLNLTGADSVVFVDLWWNPAVEDQARDRVHRIGQKDPVSCYKLVTLNTIEEKIIELQNRKKGLVKQLVCSDEEAVSKLTWEEVLELLQI